jgi:hypothetical protein
MTMRGITPDNEHARIRRDEGRGLGRKRRKNDDA